MVGLLLPPRYRSRIPAAEDTGRGIAIASGLAQLLIAGALYTLRFIHFGRGNVEIARLLIQEANKRSPENPLVLPTPAVGILVLTELLFKPLNIFLFYLFFEALVRTLAAIADDKVGSLPLYLVSALQSLWSRAQYKRSLGPLIADHLVRFGGKQGYDLKVYSCRPKLNWNPSMTVEFEGTFYQYFQEEHGPLRAALFIS
jgi:hypothetical protein